MTRRQLFAALCGVPFDEESKPTLLLLTSGRSNYQFRNHGVFTCRETLESERKRIQREWDYHHNSGPEWNSPVEAVLDRAIEERP